MDIDTGVIDVSTDRVVAAAENGSSWRRASVKRRDAVRSVTVDFAATLHGPRERVRGGVEDRCPSGIRSSERVLLNANDGRILREER